MNMKFRMKTMATLFAAVLIAMTGVMTALAYDKEVTTALSVDIKTPKVLGISITVGDGAFGDVYQGSTATLTTPLELLVESEAIGIVVEAELYEFETTTPLVTGLFFDMMVTVGTDTPTSLLDFSISHGAETTTTYDIDFEIDTAGESIGGQSATLVFWIVE